MSNSYDLIVIGGGPGGYVAAIRAAQLGLRTAVVEREHLGGICLNWGCIPTKALLRSADIFRYARHAKDFGLRIEGEVSFDAEALVKRSRAVAARLNAGVEFLCKKNKIDVIWGEASLTAPGEVRVAAPKGFGARPQFPKPKSVLGDGAYTAAHVIVATGARPRALPGLEPDGRARLDLFRGAAADVHSEVAARRRRRRDRRRIRVLLFDLRRAGDAGRGAAADSAAEDAEIAALARKSFEKQGIKIVTNAKVARLDRRENSVAATIVTEGGETLVEAERVISAVGVVPNSEGLGLEALGVKIGARRHPHRWPRPHQCRRRPCDRRRRGPPMLAHKAEHEGVVCVEAIAGLSPHAIERTRIPACTYCHPQIASVGLTEAAAKEAGYELKVGRFPYLANGKAIAMGEAEGLVKTIFDTKSGRLLGAHLIGEEVTELIQGFVIAMTLETTEAELIETIFPHPTLSETMHESALDAYGRAIHI